jgi:hypothetical protein
MSRNTRNEKERNRNVSEITGLGLSEPAITPIIEASKPERRNVISPLKRHYLAIGAIATVLFLGPGVMAKNGRLPNTHIPAESSGPNQHNSKTKGRTFLAAPPPSTSLNSSMRAIISNTRPTTTMPTTASHRSRTGAGQ